MICDFVTRHTYAGNQLQSTNNYQILHSLIAHAHDETLPTAIVT